MNDNKEVHVPREKRYSIVLVYTDGTKQCLETRPIIDIDREMQQYTNGSDYIISELIGKQHIVIPKAVRRIQIEYRAQNKMFNIKPLYSGDIQISENKKSIYDEIASEFKALCYMDRKFFEDALEEHQGMLDDTKIQRQVIDLMQKRENAASLKDGFAEEFYRYLKLQESKGYRKYRDWYIQIRNHKMEKNPELRISEPPILYDPQIRLFDNQEKGHFR
jgi:hypothetical protein